MQSLIKPLFLQIELWILSPSGPRQESDGPLKLDNESDFNGSEVISGGTEQGESESGVGGRKCKKPHLLRHHQEKLV